MADDEVFAKKLQEQFDEEERQRKVSLKNDNEFAKKIAKSLHRLSDSDNDDQIIGENSEKGAKKKVTESKVRVLPPCPYGSKCYRKNVNHFQEYSHKDSTATTSALHNSETPTPPRKKLKVPQESQKEKVLAKKNLKKLDTNRPRSFAEKIEDSQPYRLFLNKVFSVKETRDDPLGLVFPELLSPRMGTLIESLQLNFMVDLNFVQSMYDACRVTAKPVLIVYGQMEGDPKTFPSAVLAPVKMPFQFGVHHSKIMMFQYQEGLRIVIHTANLVPDDWEEKTQGYWLSPLFPPLPNGKSSVLDGESPTGFKKDFVDYLLSYKITSLTRWSYIVKSHDFSACKAIFIGSVPGYHKGQEMIQFGHPKVRHLLKKYSGWQSGTAASVIAQCSSIGSLGKDAKSWLTGEFGVSLSGGNEYSKSTVNVIYPSEHNVKNSSQGYGGGSCLPYRSATHSKQEWIMQHFHCWSSDRRKRSESMPHIKTYTRIRGDKLQYVIMTSANLSKAAWGQYQKDRSQLFIRSYEAGVLLLPKYLIAEDSFDYKENGLLPYDIPLTRYESGSRPWLMDTEKISRDRMGQTYP